MRIRVAGAQMAVPRDVRHNAAAILEAIDQAAAAGADILVTPEGPLSGYTHRFVRRAVRDALRDVTRAARESGVGLALGTCLIEPDRRWACRTPPQGTALFVHGIDVDDEPRDTAAQPGHTPEA